jgi:diphthine-ammonia ligase
VTISCKTALSTPQPLQIQLTFFNPPITPSQSGIPKKALHVQSRSYWAPANIGPYSQAVAYPCVQTTIPRYQSFNQRHYNETDNVSDDEAENEEAHPPTWLVKIAGQIPLIPASMALPVSLDDGQISYFKSQAVLSLQHLWRIGVAMDVKWFSGAVAYIPSRLEISGNLDGASYSKIVAKTWELAHTVPDETTFE